MVNCDFINERGNSIHLEMRRLPLPQDPSIQAVEFRLFGPTSMTEQIMTRKEAAILGELLLAASGSSPMRGRRLNRHGRRQPISRTPSRRKD